MEARLLVYDMSDVQRHPLALEGDVTLGGDDCDIELPGVDEKCALIKFDSASSQWLLIELPDCSQNIIVIVDNAEFPLPGCYPLANGNQIRCGQIRCELQVILETPLLNGNPTDRIPLRNRPLLIGRPGEEAYSEEVDILEIDPACARIRRVKGGNCHVSVEEEDGDYYVTDVGVNSSKELAVTLNGYPFDRKKLVYGNRLGIDEYRFEFNGRSLRNMIGGRAGATVEASEVSVVVPDRETGDPLEILKVGSLRIEAGEFIGILGGSGQGKSTLLSALCGIAKPTTGQVEVGGIQLSDRDTLREIGIGFVPQDDIVHRELTVIDALLHASRLRLDLPETQLRSRIDDVLEALSLKPRENAGSTAKDFRQSRISILSGGQRKRVSIAIELLSRPQVLFLDEPSSGLDLQSEQELMELLQTLSKTGITVICTTHVLEMAHLFSRLLWIHGGRVIFLGTTTEARQHFLSSGEDASESAGGQLAPLRRIYGTVMKSDKPALQWEEEFLAGRKALPSLRRQKPESSIEKSKTSNVREVSSPVALVTLLRRQLDILLSDRWNMIFLLTQSLAIAFLIGWVSESLELRLFLAMIAVLWFGCSNGAQQIVTEIPILKRERVCGLGLNTYLLSKLIFVSSMTLVQAVILMVTMVSVSLFSHGPDVHLGDVDRVLTVKDEFRDRIYNEEGGLLPLSEVGLITRFDLWRRLYEERRKLYGSQGGELVPVFAEIAMSDADELGAEEEPEGGPAFLNRALSFLALVFHLDRNTEPAEKGVTAYGDYWKVSALAIALRLLAVALAAVTGVCLGLAVSALVRSPTQSVMWVPLLMIPQILLGGFVITIPEMNSAVRSLSSLVPSFAVERIGQVSLVYGHEVPRMTNKTKVPNFVKSKDEVVEFREGGEWESERYDQLSAFNAAWQNLIVDPGRVGHRKKEEEQIGTDAVEIMDRETRSDVLYRFRNQGAKFEELDASSAAILTLVFWILLCYGTSFGALILKEKG